MRAYKCDICKKYFEHHVTEFKNKDIKYFNSLSFYICDGTSYRFVDRVILDACPNCMIKLMKCAKIDNMKYSFDNNQEKMLEEDER